MSSMGYLAFAVSVINSVVNAANNINNNDNNNNNNNNDNNNNNNNVNIQNSNNNQNNMNMLIAGRQLPVERLLELQERLARHHQVRIDLWNISSVLGMGLNWGWLYSTCHLDVRSIEPGLR